MKTITVCDACLQASCWQGMFYCTEYQSAGTVEKTIWQLLDLGLEHPSYWVEHEDDLPDVWFLTTEHEVIESGPQEKFDLVECLRKVELRRPEDRDLVQFHCTPAMKVHLDTLFYKMSPRPATRLAGIPIIVIGREDGE